MLDKLHKFAIFINMIWSIWCGRLPTPSLALWSNADA
jgi:hypothetical protein